MNLQTKVATIVLAGLMLYMIIVSIPNVFTVANESSLTSIRQYSYKIYNSDNDTVYQSIDKFIRQFLQREYLTGGASVAISKDGRLVYAKGIGFSNIEDSIEMQPYNIMRVASVSKLITAVAVMKLVEQQKIGLHQRVFGPLGVLNQERYMYFKDKRMADITVYQLLNHSGGWTAHYGDPMFMPHAIARQMGKSLPVSMPDIIRFMQEKWMHFTPGMCSVYSNFGYGILGEVVSKASGMPYEEYVKIEVLAPLGIYDMQIGYAHKSLRLPCEVTYYEADTSHVALDILNDTLLVRRAYGGTDIQTLGSAGGWVASATDLLKFVLTIDGFRDNIPDQLSALSVDTMTHYSLGFDPLGWKTTIGDSWYRSGTLAATTAMIARHPNGICYVILLNCANHRGPALATSLRIQFDNVINSIEDWPEIDLLADDEQWQTYKLISSKRDE